jgi:putative MATE family efflux protein
VRAGQGKLLHVTPTPEPGASGAPLATPELAISAWWQPFFSADRRHDREIARLALPALATLAAPPLVGLVDVFIAGRLGVGAQSALALGVAMFGLLVFSTNFLEYGTTAVVAQRTGAGDDRGAWRAAGTALAAASVIGVLLLAATLLLADVLANDVMRASSANAGPAAAYLRIRMVGAIPYLLLRVANGWFRGRGDTVTPFLVATGTTVLAIALAPPFAFGVGGWDGWGLEGIAIATVAAEALGGLVILALMSRLKGRRSPAPGLAVDLPETGGAHAWRTLFALNRDILLRTLAVTGTFTLASATASQVDRSGATAAAHGIVMSAWLLSALALDSLAIAAQSITGRLLGAGRPAVARRAAARILTMEAGAGAAVGLALAVAAPFLADALSADPAVRNLALRGFLILAALMPLSAVVFGADGVLLGAGDGRFMRNSMALAAAPACALLGVVALTGGPLTAIWACVGVFVAARMAAVTWRLRGDGWARRRL